METTRDENVITLANVTKTVDGHDIARDLTFTVRRGELFGLIGPSGGGKTTTVRLMVGIYKATAGEVRVFDTDPTRLSLKQRQRIGYMPQHFFLYPTLTASENLAYIAGVYGIGWLRRRKVIPRVLRDMELWDARDRLANDLSGGMLRRLQLAAVMLHDPALMFIDEPMAGLDPLLRERMWQILRGLRDHGSTVVLTTQITQEAERCDRVALLKGGGLVAVGTPEELRLRALGGQATRVLVGGRTHEAISILWGEQDVSEVTPLGDNAIRIVTSEDHGTLQRVLDNVRSRGISVQAVEKTTPSFDEVFERLVRGA